MSMLSARRAIGAITLLSVLLTACNMPTNRIPSSGVARDGEGVQIMAYVQDVKGDPVEFATVGSDDLFTNESGVAAGTISSSDSDWITVSANGFAPAYAAPITSVNDQTLFWVTLSPITSAILYDPATGGDLISREGSEHDLSISIQPGILSGESIQISLTEIPLETLDAHYQPLTKGAALHLQQAFSIEAATADGSSLKEQFEDGVTVRVPLPEGSHGDWVLASFDSSTGMWEPIKTDCTIIDNRFLECPLPHFSLHGFFGVEPPAESEEEELEEEQDSEGIGSFTISLDDYRGAADGSSGGQEGSGNGTEEATDNVIDNAQSDSGGGGERDKMALMIAGGLAFDSGNAAMAEQLLEEARHETRRIGEELLQSERCETYHQLLTTAAQAQTLGGLDDLATRLIDKATDLHKKCVIISGTITYNFYLNPLWPGAEQWVYNRGTQVWTEIHKVHINIDPKTGAVDGEDHVTLRMPAATYRVEENSPCGPVRVDRAIENTPESGTATLLFKGNYDGDVFQIGEMQVADSNPVGMLHRTYYNPTYTPPPECGPYQLDVSSNSIADYTSHLLHGFFGSPQPPSLETMLNEGTRMEFEDYKVVWGMDGITYTRGENLSPLIPVHGARVEWRFTQVSTVGGGS